MSFLLADTTASAAFQPGLPKNLLCRSWAHLHDVEATVSHIMLSVTLSCTGHIVMPKFDFEIVDDDLHYDAIFGPQWIEWCRNAFSPHFLS